MGKKNRRKKGDKRERKERLEERRERLNEIVDGRNEELDEEEYECPRDHPLMVGDRVWFAMGEEDYSRGVLKATEPSNKVLRVDIEDREDLYESPFMIFRRDLNEWTLRFAVDDPVICHVGGRWVEAVVRELWPADARATALPTAPRYRCERSDGILSAPIIVDRDTDEFIWKRPTEYRFSVGDEVIVATMLALGINITTHRRLEPWIRGRVVSAGSASGRDFFVAYECTYEDGKKQKKCFVLQDNDENVASPSATPRERLIGSIEQDCSYNHIDYLVKSSGMDIMTIRDLLISKAIESANYDALLWLQENAGVDLHRIHDSENNGLLHQIAKSPHAERFFHEAALVEWGERPDEPSITFDNYRDADCHLTFQKNNEGRTFLHVLIASGNMRALDLAMSPSMGLGWLLSTHLFGLRATNNEALSDVHGVTRDKRGLNLKDTARLLGRYSAEKMIDEFADFHSLKVLSIKVGPVYTSIGRSELSLSDRYDFAKFGRDTPSTIARRLIRLHDDRQYLHVAPVRREGRGRTIEETMGHLSRVGQLDSISWLIEEEPSLLYTKAQAFGLPSNRDEFVQVSTSDDVIHYTVDNPVLDLVGFASAGDISVRPTDLDDSFISSYYSILERFGYTFDIRKKENSDFSLVRFLNGQQERHAKDYSTERMLKLKLCVLQDDEILAQRLHVLDYLVKDKCVEPPNALSAIRWRQCGVLRWLVENSYIDLQGKAHQDPSIALYGTDMLFLGRHKSTTSMTVGEFLCLAAIEFDDLQSLQWLVEVKNVDYSSIRFDGMNVLHFCSRFGRAEIVLWMMQSPAVILEPLAQEECTRGPWAGNFAVHISVKRGFTFVADLLISVGSPLLNASGEAFTKCAKLSRMEAVREWGNQKEKPLLLEKDIRETIDLVSGKEYRLNEVKHHISQSGCLAWRRWTDCGYNSVDSRGPLGKTYREVLAEFREPNDPELICWLCETLSPYSYDYKAIQWEEFWGQNDSLPTNGNGADLDAVALQSFASENDYTLLRICLNKPWARDVNCVDPVESYPLLRYFCQAFATESTVHTALLEVRKEFLLVDALHSVKQEALDEIMRLFATGGTSREVRDVIRHASDVACENGQSFEEFEIISSTGTVNLEAYIGGCDYGKVHPLRGMVDWWGESNATLSRLYIVVSVEGYRELISWLRSEHSSSWNPRIEADMIRIAAYLGHTNVVDIFLRNRKAIGGIVLSPSDAYKAATLGAAEAGDMQNLAVYFGIWTKLVQFSDPIVDGSEIPRGYQDDRYDLRTVALKTSLVGSVVFDCLNNADSQELLNVLKWILGNGIASPKDIVRAISLALEDLQEITHLGRCIHLLRFLCSYQDFNLLSCEDDMIHVSEIFLKCGNGKTSSEEAMSLRWVELASANGFDIQEMNLDSSFVRRDHYAEIEESLAAIQAVQRRTWSQFDMIKENRPMEVIVQAVENGDIDLTLHYRGGFLATHLAAAYDRLDILQWLVESKDVSLDAIDAKGRSVLDVANASNAVAAADWIALNTAGGVIASFVSSNYRRRRALETKTMLLQCVRTIQAWQRGNAARRVHRGRLVHRLGETQWFHEIWDGSISRVDDPRLSGRTWNEMKHEEHDIMRSLEDVGYGDEMEETTEKLSKAASRALSEKSSHVEGNVQDEVVQQPAGDKEPATIGDMSKWNPDDSVDIKFTNDVVKWLRHGDNKYRDFFIRRMKQLAAGDRSRILAKRLTGSKTLIYETYLEQKSGYRILWTENTDDSLLIWYVAKHKNVSRLMELIDDAERRSSRQLTSASSLPELQSGDDKDENCSNLEHIMLDPLGDTPLKLYAVHADEIENLIDPTWKPRLYLTARERHVVETRGTVLLLGRSGTGKTCVIGNRMDYDRQLVGDDNRFKQLFVARSKGLCDYVKEAVDGDRYDDMSFNTFSEVVISLESLLPLVSSDESTNACKIFLPSMKMDFRRFKRDFYVSDSSNGGIDALVAWSNIRSFIKGSIEALRHPDGELTETEYIGFGKKRCRLSPEQRKAVYDTYRRYDKYMKELGLWDDCDRITALVQRLAHARTSDSLAYQEVKYNKLYVDEVQDYTQAEIALFFYICGPGDLFLAGDPAQSVVEGVEFRFEEIRSVGYHLYGEDRRHLIPDKPRTVHVNFRSHCGILNIAAAVLSCLFEAFPDSAKQLKEDRGLFQGPRPGVLHKVEAARLQELVSKRDGIVVLTHDQNVSKWKRALQDYPLVYGIREAKGLEFREVILVDFFVDIPSSLQKMWRNLLLGRDVADISCHPEIEGHLKLLYTAITRCIQRLFFAETSSSVAGDAFVRWLTTTSTMKSIESSNGKEALAVKNHVENVETMVRTPDEWRSAGLDNAVMAESSDDLLESETWLDRALYCFMQVGENVLASRVRTHRSSNRFRSSRLSSRDTAENVDAAQIEVDAAILVEQLLSEQLFWEARNVCREIIPLLGTRQQELLDSCLLSKLTQE